jgi:membrane protease YdiL (CAAX protease family)
VAGTAGQVRAIVVLLARHLRRRAPRAGASPKKSGVPTFLLLGAVWAAYMGSFIFRVCDQAAGLGEGRAQAIGWQVLGVSLILIGFGLGELAPELGRIRSPLRAALLDELPVTTAARLVLAWIRNPLAIALPIVTVFAWSPSARGLTAGASLRVLEALLWFLACMTSGYAFATWVRVLGSATVRRVIAVGSFALVIAGLPLITTAPGLGSVSPGRVVLGLARAFADGERPLLAITALAGWLGAAVGLVALGELRGYDRLDAASAKRRRPTVGRLSLDRVEQIVMRRESGLAVIIVQVLVLLSIVTLAVFSFFSPPKAERMKQLAIGYAGFVAYIGAIVSLNQAGLGSRRDAGVRSLLAPLPLSPFDTLGGKVRALRRLLLPLFLSALPVLAVAARWSLTVEPSATIAVVWRTAVTMVGVWLAADAAVSVAFLSNGLGLPGARSMGAPTNYATLLLMLPLLAAATAQNALIALCSLATLGAIGAEARRAARLCVRWVDDAADDIQRETTVWRALLALAAFFAVQALGAQFLRLGTTPSGTRLAIGYGIAGVVLVVMTVQGRRNLAPLRLLPSLKQLVALPIGIVGGAASAVCALGFAELVRRFAPVGEDLSPVQGHDVVWLAVALVGMAPIAEELFFRGWLQPAIAADLPPSRKRWAFALAALAFGFAHVGGYLLPQVILGALAGALYAWSGALLPGMLAHAVHNGLVLFLS